MAVDDAGNEVKEPITILPDHEKWNLIEQFARRVVSIKDYDVFLSAVG